MKWILDTDTVVYYMRAMRAVVQRLETTSSADRYLTLITLGELYFGIQRSTRAERNLGRYRRFFARVKIVPFTPAVAERFGALKANLTTRGKIIADHDLWIAAHALVYGATLVTNNERDFVRISGLRIANWTN